MTHDPIPRDESATIPCSCPTCWNPTRTRSHVAFWTTPAGQNHQPTPGEPTSDDGPFLAVLQSILRSAHD
eukprot:gene8171-7525_t